MKINGKTNEQIQDNLERFPDYTIVCKLAKILDDRSLTMSDLSRLTGIRIGSISELAKMTRTTINIPHMLVIAQTLRITNLAELFELKMSEETYTRFTKDKVEIDLQGRLSEQMEYLKTLKTKK